MVCADGDFLSRILVPVVFIAGRAQIAHAANLYRRQDAQPVKRYRRSKEQEAAVATLVTFIDPAREVPALHALNQTIVNRGQGAFRLSALSAAHELLADLGVMKVYRDTRDGRATSKRYRLLDEMAVKALVAGLPLHALHDACKIVHRLPFARAAFPRLAELTAWVEDRRWAWACRRALLVEDVIAQCGELAVRGLSRGRSQPIGGAVLSRRLELIDAPIAGWDDASGTCDLAPHDDLLPPRFSDENQGKTGKPAAASGRQMISETELTQNGICEQDHCNTELPCITEEDDPMSNLTGRRVMTKEEQVAADRLRKQGAKAARADATTSRALGDMVAVTGPSDATVTAIRANVLHATMIDPLDEAAVEEFLGKMRSYGWRGKTQKQVDDTVMLWFGERVANGSFRVKRPATQGSAPTIIPIEAAYRGLCGNDDVAGWRAKIKASPAARHEEEALFSASKIAASFAGAPESPAWSGVKAIAERVGSCAYLFHIASLEIGLDGALTVSVLHPTAEPHSTQIAKQHHADAVAETLSALMGVKVHGVPAEVPWVRMSNRDLVNRAF